MFRHRGKEVYFLSYSSVFFFFLSILNDYKKSEYFMLDESNDDIKVKAALEQRSCHLFL